MDLTRNTDFEDYAVLFHNSVRYQLPPLKLTIAFPMELNISIGPVPGLP